MTKIVKPTTAASHWICPPYGAPTATSEANRVAGFYRVSALTVVAAARAAPAARAA